MLANIDRRARTPGELADGGGGAVGAVDDAADPGGQVAGALDAEGAAGHTPRRSGANAEGAAAARHRRPAPAAATHQPVDSKRYVLISVGVIHFRFWIR